MKIEQNGTHLIITHTHTHKILEQVELICSDRKNLSGCLEVGWVEFSTKRDERTL